MRITPLRSLLPHDLPPAVRLMACVRFSALPQLMFTRSWHTQYTDFLDFTAIRLLMPYLLYWYIYVPEDICLSSGTAGKQLNIRTETLNCFPTVPYTPCRMNRPLRQQIYRTS